MAGTLAARADRAPYGRLAPYNHPADSRPALHRRAERFYTGIADIIRSQKASHTQLLRELHDEELRLQVPGNNPIKIDYRNTWGLLCIVEQPDHPQWGEAIQDLDNVPMQWKTDYTGAHCTAEEDYLADRWYDDHDEDMPVDDKLLSATMAALRKEHIEPNERPYWKIRDNIKSLLHHLRDILNAQNSDFARF
jgi:hypothetical protein